MKARLLLLAAILVLVCMPLACSCEETKTAKVTTVGAFEVYGDGATLKGRLDDMGGCSRVEVWFSIRKLGDTPKETLMAAGEFSYRVTNLDPHTTYFYTAHAKGDIAEYEGDGEELDFNIAELTGQP